MVAGKTRKFNGETFRLVPLDESGFEYGSKTDAKRIAEGYRRRGYLARVVDEGWGHQVYVKEKVYRAHHGKALRDAKGRTIRLTR